MLRDSGKGRASPTRLDGTGLAYTDAAMQQEGRATPASWHAACVTEREGEDAAQTTPATDVLGQPFEAKDGAHVTHHLGAVFFCGVVARGLRT